MLTQQQRSQLLRIAREAIAAVLDGRRAELSPESFDDELRRPAGAFVTLTAKDDALRGCLGSDPPPAPPLPPLPAGACVTLTAKDAAPRGCIGSIHPVAPLYRAVHDSAINAAFRDPRFFPLRKEEYPDIHIEISVMGQIGRAS